MKCICPKCRAPILTGVFCDMCQDPSYCNRDHKKGFIQWLKTRLRSTA